MLRLLSIMLVSLYSLAIAAQEGKEVEMLQNDVVSLQEDVQTLGSIVRSLKREAQRREADFSQKLGELQMSNEALAKKNKNLETALGQVADTLGVSLRGTRDTMEANKATADSKILKIVLWGSIGLVVVLLIALCVFFVLRKRIKKGTLDIDAVREANKQLSEQSVALDNRLAELLERQLAMDKSMKSLSNVSTEIDHSLALSIANEVCRIEQNLAYMDSKTKGVSQLKNRSAAIITTLKAKGYEIPNLLGTEYKEGMNCDVTMEEDESMKPGIQLIKRVMKPCVIYKQEMIQMPKVVVSYNPE